MNAADRMTEPVAMSAVEHLRPLPDEPEPGEPKSTAPDSELPLVQLAQKAALSLREADLLGYGSERQLRGLIASGRLLRCVLHIGRRGIRLHQATLVEELRIPERA